MTIQLRAFSIHPITGNAHFRCQRDRNSEEGRVSSRCQDSGEVVEATLWDRGRQLGQAVCPTPVSADISGSNAVAGADLRQRVPRLEGIQAGGLCPCPGIDEKGRQVNWNHFSINCRELETLRDISFWHCHDKLAIIMTIEWKCYPILIHITTFLRILKQQPPPWKVKRTFLVKQKANR